MGCGINPPVKESELLKDPICGLGSGVGGSGVAVGKYVAVGASGWNGVAVAVAFAGLKRKFGFMLIATGELAGAAGKLQARLNPTSTRRMMGSLLRMGEMGNKYAGIHVLDRQY